MARRMASHEFSLLVSFRQFLNFLSFGGSGHGVGISD